MSNFSDIESPSTVDHSTGVEALVADAARRAGLPHADVTTLRRARSSTISGVSACPRASGRSLDR